MNSAGTLKSLRTDFLHYSEVLNLSSAGIVIIMYKLVISSINVKRVGANCTPVRFVQFVAKHKFLALSCHVF